MAASLTVAINEAFSRPEPDDRIDAIKTAVSRQLEATDGGAEIRHTEYFNNSIAPDLVLKWPTENRERFVFLRPNSAPDWFFEEVAWMAPGNPMIITLNTSVTRGESPLSREVQEGAMARDILVANPEAVEELSSKSRTEPAAGLLAQAVLRGGRGVLDGQRTHEAVETTIEGFIGAERVALRQTRLATELISALLRPEQASRIGRVLQSVWEGNGGRSSEFPGQRDLSGRMTDGDLEFLISSLPNRDIDFWRKIGRSLEISQIARLELGEYSPNLQLLIAANADTLLTRGLRILNENQRLDEINEEVYPRWVIARNCLALRGIDWTAYIAANSVNELPKSERHNGPVATDLRARADRSSTPISNVELDTGDRVISYSSKEGEDVMHDSRLGQLANRREIKVRRATVIISGSRRLSIDFTTLTASGYTSSTFPLSDIVKSAFPVLVDVDQETEVVIDRMADSEPEIAIQGTLDFEIE
jgi:hypothetical protein